VVEEKEFIKRTLAYNREQLAATRERIKDEEILVHMYLRSIMATKRVAFVKGISLD
jgi:hypothetical protein